MAGAAVALSAVEDSLLYLRNQRLTDELGVRAVELLAAERTVDDAPEVLRRIRRLLAHYHATAGELPAWCESFVTAGYAHYCTLLPTAFVDEHTGVRQVAAMLGFLFSMEGLALTLGCDRAQLELAVRQSHPEAPAKTALLWAAQFQLGLLPLTELRSRCAELLGNPLVVPSFPLYLSGFIQALEPVRALAPFVVETLSTAFARLPDRVLLPWLPTLIATLRQEAAELVPVLVREAGRTFPATLSDLDTWQPPWLTRSGTGSAPSSAPVGVTRRGMFQPVAHLLVAWPDTCDAVAGILCCDAGWRPAGVVEPDYSAVTRLIAQHPATGTAVAELVA